MRHTKLLALVLVVAAGVILTASFVPNVAVAHAAQVSVSIGAAPVCPYGYYETPPYQCAPYGYYGPEWFNGGVFIGAGPWFHGPANFYGHVDNRFHPAHGYRGPFPEHTDQRFNHFHGNEVHDPHGHVRR